MSTHREIRALTGLRGIAALYVVLHHYADGLAPTNPVNILIAHGYLAVDLFFVLSGFVMALNYRHLFEGTPFRQAYTLFLGRRIARIYPLYLCGTIIGCIEHILRRDGVFSTAFYIKTFALNAAMVQAWVLGNTFDGPCWSLSAEWAAYLVFPALLSIAFFKPTLRHWLGLFFGLAAVLAFAWLPHLLHNPTFSFSNDFFSLRVNQTLRCIPEFTLGILLVRGLGTAPARALERLFLAHSWTVTLVSLTIVALLMSRRTDFLIVLLLPLLLLSLLQAGSLPARLLSSRAIYFSGLISYSIYIFHDLLADTMHYIHAWADLHGLQHAQTWAAGFALLITVPVSILSYKYIEVPGARRLRRWFEGPPASKPTHPTTGSPDPGPTQPPALAFPPNSR